MIAAVPPAHRPAIADATVGELRGLGAWAAALEFGIATAAEEATRVALRRAAAALRGQVGAGGRPAIDDTIALRQMRDLITTGHCAKPWPAALFVAKTLAFPQQSLEATARRLVKKFRRL